MPGTVYILGAGASLYDCAREGVRIPLAQDFFRPEYLVDHWSMPDRAKAQWTRSSLCKIMTRYFAGRERASLNIEEVYSFVLSMMKNPFLDALTRVPFENAQREMLQYIFNVLSSASLQVRKPRLVRHLLKRLKREDTIVSFNWDVLLDSAAYAVSPKHPLLAFQSRLLKSSLTHTEWYSGHLFDVPTHPAYVKIHGSINLATCENPDCIHSSVPYRCEPCDEWPEFYRCENCGHSIKTFLLPPHVAKSYATNNFVRLQAAVMVARLRVADHIVIIGYSFPDLDSEAQALFRGIRLESGGPEDMQMHLKRITVVNPSVCDETYTRRVRDVLGLLNPKLAYGRVVRFKTFDNIDEYLKKN